MYAEMDKVKKELWFWYFTQVLRENGIISDQRKQEIEKTLCPDIYI